jgi:hypothetical protein
MFIRLAELAVLLFLAWVIANVVRAVLFKASRGGGFWAISDAITRADREKMTEAAIEAEVKRRLAALAADARKPEGGAPKQ